MNNDELTNLKKIFLHEFVKMSPASQKGIIISLFRLADNNVRHDLFQQNQANYVYKVNVINKHTQKLINNLGNYNDANQAILAMNQFNTNNISDNFLAQIEIY